jgi:exosome complex protein LRP1
MSELPEDVQTVISNLDTSLSSLEEHLGPLLEIPWDDLTGRLDPMEKAKLNLMMAYSTASLFYMYLKSQVLESDHISSYLIDYFLLQSKC